jgi:hypothetical protein
MYFGFLMPSDDDNRRVLAVLVYLGFLTPGADEANGC